MADGIVIKISGDDSPLRKTLAGIGKTASAALKGITAVSGVLSAAWGIAGAATVKYNANLEQLTTSFEVMTGSAEEAASIVERLKTMGAETPFETLDLAETTQLLMNYGITADEAISRMSMLGDIAQGSAEKMQRIATAYGQMSSAGKVQLEDIRQMIESGYNPLQEIAESTGESMASLYERISKGTLAVEEITASMERSTSEGGKYFESMAKQAETLSGRLSTLKDEAQSFLGNLFSGATDSLRDDVLPMATDIIDALNTGFESGGIDGLMNAFNRELPKLLTWGVNAAKNVMSGISKQLPGLVKSLFSALPSVRSSVTELTPELVTSLMGVASEVVENLIAQLPELVPVILQGLANIAESIIAGALDIVSGMFDGIEQAFHQGQEKVAGVWVDSENVAEHNLTIDFTVDETQATSEIESAYAAIREALMAGPLTPEQEAEVMANLGAGAEAISELLESYGWDPEVAEATAATITESGAIIMSAIDSLDLGVSSSTVMQWFAQAEGSNVALMHAAREAGLSDEQINELIAIYNEAVGRLGTETPSIAESIYTALTDGLADDETVVSDLYDQVSAWVEDRMSEIEEAYENAKAKLDPTSPEYEAQLAALEAEYELAKSSVEEIHSNALTIVDTLAGQSTESVENAYQQIADLETSINSLETRIEELKGEALEAGESAYKVVTAGGNADTATIDQAIKFKFNEWKLDTQSAEEAYQETIDELNELFSNGEITLEEYNEGQANADAAREAAVAAAQAEFERAYGEILRGIAESEGNAAAFDENSTKAAAIQALTSLADELQEVGWDDLGGDKKQAIADNISDLMEQTVTVEDLEFRGAGVWITEAISQGINDMDTSVLEGKVGETLSATLESGMLEGTSFDTESQTAQLAAVFGSTFTSAANQAASQAQAAGQSLASEGAAGTRNAQGEYNSAGQALGSSIAAGISSSSSGVNTAASDTAGSGSTGARVAYQQYQSAGEYLGTGLANGIASKRSAVMAQARSIANAAAAAIRSALQISSPSKVTTQLGEYTGEGFEIGLTDSLTRAVESARRIAGTLNLTPRMDFPDVTGALTGAVGSIYEAESGRSINLYINGKQMATTTAGDNRWAQANRARRIALGVGRKL